MKKTFSGFKVWFNCSGFNHVTCISNFNFYLFGIITKQFHDTIKIKFNSKPMLYINFSIKTLNYKFENISLKGYIYHYLSCTSLKIISLFIVDHTDPLLGLSEFFAKNIFCLSQAV